MSPLRSGTCPFAGEPATVAGSSVGGFAAANRSLAVGTGIAADNCKHLPRKGSGGVGSCCSWQRQLDRKRPAAQALEASGVPALFGASSACRLVCHLGAPDQIPAIDWHRGQNVL
jgi:hypothetical protein